MKVSAKYLKYAMTVETGSIVAGAYVKAAVKRYLSWFERPEFEFREDKVERVVHFMYNITHGTNPKLEVDLQPWQLFIIYNVFGWYHVGTDERVIHNVYIEVARKNGKSTLISLFSLYMMMADGEYESEVDVVANSHKQAKILYKMAANYCENIDPRGKYFKRYRDNIQFDKQKSAIQVLASDTNTLDGYNAYMFVQDEVHEAKDDQLYNVLKTSQAARVNPLAVLITTAGLNMDSFCYNYRQNCLDVLYGNKTDDSQFSLIFSLDEGDDYRDPEVWIKANPNLGVSVRESYLLEQVQSAENNTALTSNILTKNFNIWSQTFDVWIPDSNMLGVMKPVDPAQWVDQNVVVGVDLAAVSDLTAVSLLHVDDEGKNHQFYTRYYIPSDCLRRGFNMERYREWYHNGQLVVCPGNVTDYDFIANDLCRFRDMGIVIENVFYDTYNASQWVIKMTEEGFYMTPFSQGLGNFNRGTKEIERLIKNAQCEIDNNPITRWCFQNATLKVDYNENCKPVKANSENYKIDGVIAMVEALGGYLTAPHYSIGI